MCSKRPTPTGLECGCPVPRNRKYSTVTFSDFALGVMVSATSLRLRTRVAGAPAKTAVESTTHTHTKARKLRCAAAVTERIGTRLGRHRPRAEVHRSTPARTLPRSAPLLGRRNNAPGERGARAGNRREFRTAAPLSPRPIGRRYRRWRLETMFHLRRRTCDTAHCLAALSSNICLITCLSQGRKGSKVYN